MVHTIDAFVAMGRQLDSRVIRVPGGGKARITMPFLKRVWGVLRNNTLAVACVSPGHGVLADFAQRLVVRLGVRKLVLVDGGGGVANEAGLVSFMDVVMLGRLLQHGEGERIGVGRRRPVLEAVRAALQGGVDSVNLCDLRGVERELFTYEGVGTLFTLEDYCRVERLRVDDFPEVEKLLERGQQEGYLRERNAKEIAEILMGGYGATIGSGHLAGVCALTIEPYRSERAGEIVALYTITRSRTRGSSGFVTYLPALPRTAPGRSSSGTDFSGPIRLTCQRRNGARALRATQNRRYTSSHYSSEPTSFPFLAPGIPNRLATSLRRWPS